MTFSVVAKIEITNLINYTDSEKQTLFNEILPKVEEIRNSQCFGDFILKRKMQKTRGLTNKEILNDLRHNSAKITLQRYWSLYNTTGYTLPNINKIWLNERIHDKISICRQSANVLHELSHKWGYFHDKYWHKLRDFSVPYSVNAAFKACCPTKIVRVCTRSWRDFFMRKCYDKW